MNPDLSAITDVDGFALAMLAILAASLGIVLIILLAIFRQGKRGDSEVDQLIDEVGRPEEKPQNAGPPQEKPREPWERDADWWKKD